MFWESIDYSKRGASPLDGGQYLVTTPKGLMEAMWSAKFPLAGARDLAGDNLPAEGLPQDASFWLGRGREAYPSFNVHHWCRLPGVIRALSEPDLRLRSLDLGTSFQRKDRTVTAIIQTYRGWIEAAYSRQADGWLSPSGLVFHRNQVKMGVVFPLPAVDATPAVLTPGPTPLWG